MYELVSLFSGCGGSSLGYQQAGFKVLLANEYVNAAAETYKANFPDTVLITHDIRSLSGNKILELIGKEKNELDLLDGSPPCNAFTSVGKRNKTWNKIRHYSDEKFQRTDDLYFEYIRILRDIMPKMFLTENVPALTHGMSRGYFNEIYSALEQSGYNIKCAILDASRYGIPQKRKRLFIMGIRNDLTRDMNPSFPTPDKRETLVRDVWNGINNSEWELEQSRKLNDCISTWIKQTPAGSKTYKVHPKETYYSLLRIGMNKPCPTVTGISRNSITDHRFSAICHYKEDRYLTISELKRISSFPDEFILTGNFSQQWERIARAVPPLLMKRLAEIIKQKLNMINHWVST